MSANPIWGDDWDEVRRLWPLDPEVAHCNHGSFGAVPIPVLAAEDGFRARMVANPVRWFHSDLTELIVEARAEVARFLGAEPDDVAFVANVTTGISAVFQSLPLGPGDEIVTTDHIYGAVSLAVDRLCRRTGATRVVVPIPFESTDDEVVAAIAARCSAKTALVVVDQLTSATARVFPVAAVADVAHAVDAAVLVDAAHVPGMLPVDVPAIGADFWLGNFHKWPCAPAGTAALWITPAWQRQILPHVVSHNDLEGFPKSFDRLGTDDQSAWLAAPYVLRMLGSLGWDRVRSHNEALVLWAQATVAEILGVPSDELVHDPGVSMAIVPLPQHAADSREETKAIADHMASLGVMMTMPCWNGRGTIRISAHVYNQPSDYERMAIGVRDFLKS